MRIRRSVIRSMVVSRLCSLNSRQQSSDLSKDFLILRVRANPEPNNCIVGFRAQCSPADTNANRVDENSRMHPLELQSGVIWVRAPETIGSASLSFYVRRKLSKCLAE